MKRVFETLVIGVAIVFFSYLQGCAAWTPEVSSCVKEQATCVSFCSATSMIADNPETAVDVAHAVAECMAECLAVCAAEGVVECIVDVE